MKLDTLETLLNNVTVFCVVLLKALSMFAEVSAISVAKTSSTKFIFVVSNLISLLTVVAPTNTSFKNAVLFKSIFVSLALLMLFTNELTIKLLASIFEIAFVDEFLSVSLPVTSKLTILALMATRLKADSLLVFFVASVI